MKQFGSLLVYLLLLICGLSMIIPFAWMLTTAVRSQTEINRGNVGFSIMKTSDMLTLGGRSYPVKIVHTEGKRAWVLFYDDNGVLDPANHNKMMVSLGLQTADAKPDIPYLETDTSNIRHKRVLDVHLKNFSEAFYRVPFGRYFINTIFMAVCILIGTLLTSALAAYAFARMKFRGRDTIFYIFISMMMIPHPVYLIPSYLLLDKIGWLDTWYALIIPWIASIFTIFLLRQHFKTLPQDLFDAAAIDGCSTLGILFRIVLPLSKSVIAAASIFSVISSWNSFMWPLIMTNSESIRVLQVGISYFAQEASTQTSLLMAASSFSILPLVILFLFAQKQIISSFASSGLKE